MYAGDDIHNIFNIQNIPTLHHCGRKENAGDSGLRLTHAQSTGRRRLTNPVPKFQNSTKCEQKSANLPKTPTSVKKTSPAYYESERVPKGLLPLTSLILKFQKRVLRNC